MKVTSGIQCNVALGPEHLETLDYVPFFEVPKQKSYLFNL